MSHERLLIAGLTTAVITILALIIALTWQLEWSLLAIGSLVFIVSYPLIWLSWKTNEVWRRSVMQLTTYTQILQEGAHNIQLKPQNDNGLLCQLQKEITKLASHNQQKTKQEHTVENLLSGILEAWTIPICMFDQSLNLSFHNQAMLDQIRQPMLTGTSANDLGFSFINNAFQHAQFGEDWQCQTISYRHQGNRHWLFSALDISSPLHQKQSITQKNLIRVLSHELRNSLTPMASMADTLLSTDKLEEIQTRKVLDRILKRSNNLLEFIGSYSQLSLLPPPQLRWFSFDDLMNEAKSMITKECVVQFCGEQQCFGDPQQLSQVMINVLKNASEIASSNKLQIKVVTFVRHQEQFVEVTDNGPGFSNLENALTPFYTTKPNGSGIGLPLCTEIVRNHDGHFVVSNIKDGGAKITMSWPITQYS